MGSIEEKFKELEKEIKQKYLTTDDLKNLHDELVANITSTFKKYYDFQKKKIAIVEENKMFRGGGGLPAIYTEEIKTPDIPVSDSHLEKVERVQRYLKEVGIATTGQIKENCDLGDITALSAQLTLWVEKGLILKQEVPVEEIEIVFGKEITGARANNGKIIGWRAI